MPEIVETWAIVVGAGTGARLQASRPKAFVGLGGRPLLAYAIEMLEDHPAIDRMVLVVPAEWEEPASLLADELVAGKVSVAVAGGATRAQSVAAGLAQVPASAGIVVVHDAARPFASAELVSRTLSGLADADGAIPALPLTDTVKRVREGRVVETLDRSQLVTVQTPQAFTEPALRAAYSRERGQLPAATDCATLVEAAGFSVAVVPGDPGNIKITDADDLRRAERLVSA
jgi:2-C-methyl-D-erythritol 4-phosphate cytidylyltransferase